MISRRVVLAAAGCLAVGGGSRAWAADPAVATVEEFYAALLAVMQDGGRLGFSGRRDRLAPAIGRAFDLPLMTRLTIGPQWVGIAPADQARLVEAFSAFSIANYARRFDGYSGERFVVDPAPTAAGGGDVLVRSRLVPKDGSPIELDYRMRGAGGSWHIIDVYLKGTVSELATRRSEFADVLRRGGAAALVDLLRQKTAELSG